MSPSEALLDLLDRISCGAVLLDAAGRMVGINAAAQSHLTELSGNDRVGAHPDNKWTWDLLRKLEQDQVQPVGHQYRPGLPQGSWPAADRLRMVFSCIGRKRPEVCP